MDDWQDRIDAVWTDDAMPPDQLVDAIDRIAAERGADDAAALFERAGARDASGREAEAEPLYRAALTAGLDDDRRVQATIQLASTLRNLGRTDEAVGMLRDEYARDPAGALHDAVAAFYALALVSAGQPQRGASVALEALSAHVPRYRRSVQAYAREIADGHA